MTAPAATDKTFTDLVGQYVRGMLPRNIEETIESDENLDRLYYALISLKKDVEVQLSNKRARDIKTRNELNNKGDDGSQWIAYRASEADWEARAKKFLGSVEEHICGAKERIASRNRENNDISFEKVYDLVVAEMEST